MSEIQLGVREVPSVNIIGQSKTSNFRLDDGNTAIFALLSDTVYSDPMHAVIREYLTNAWDSHIVAGTTHIPIVITFSQNPMRVIIEDSGTGLDREGMDGTFRFYFRSTKTKNNDVTGTFGIGSKVGFAYTDSFTISSRKDGRKYVYGLHIGPDRQPQVSDMLPNPDGIATKEANGLTIDLPVKQAADLTRFKDSLNKILTTSTMKVIAKNETGEILPLQNTDFGEALQKDGYGWIASHRVVDRDIIHVVQGQIAYPIQKRLLFEGAKGLDPSLINGLYIQTSSRTLQYSLSRETLRETPQTIAYLQNRIREIQTEVEIQAMAIARHDHKRSRLMDFIEFRQRAVGMSGRNVVDEASVQFTTGAANGARRLIYNKRADSGSYWTGNQSEPANLVYNAFCATLRQHFRKPKLTNLEVQKLLKRKSNEAEGRIQALLGHEIRCGRIDVTQYVNIFDRKPYDIAHEIYSKNRIYLDGAGPENIHRKSTLYKSVKNEGKKGASWRYEGDVLSKGQRIVIRPVTNVKATVTKKGETILRPVASVKLTLTIKDEKRREIQNMTVITPIEKTGSLEEIATNGLQRALERYGLGEVLAVDPMRHLALKPPVVRAARNVIAVDESGKKIAFLVAKDIHSHGYKAKTLSVKEVQEVPAFFIRTRLGEENTVRAVHDSAALFFARFLTIDDVLCPKIGIAKNEKIAKLLLSHGSKEIVEKHPPTTKTPTGRVEKKVLQTHHVRALAIASELSECMSYIRDKTIVTKIFCKRAKIALEAETGSRLMDLITEGIEILIERDDPKRSSEISDELDRMRAQMQKKYPLVYETHYSEQSDRERHIRHYVELMEKYPAPEISKKSPNISMAPSSETEDDCVERHSEAA